MNKNPLDVILKNDEKLYNEIDKVRQLSLSEGKLPLKTKLLIALAIDAEKGAVNGVKSLAIQALKAGVTKEEIMETIRVVFYITGVGPVYSAAAALDEVFANN